MNKNHYTITPLFIFLLGFNYFISKTSGTIELKGSKTYAIDTSVRSIHVFVALCDNKYQGIVPVPAKIGNGQDPNNNLYWGCGYGIRTYFKKSKEWKFIRTQKIDSVKIERAIFKHVTKNVFLVADAYNGKFIKQCTIDFFNACSGNLKDTFHVSNKIVGIGSHAKLISFIGHDGLMDFELDDSFANNDGRKRDCIILACVSKRYFAPHLKQTNAYPLLWTTGLMCPEAYTIHDALTGYVNGESAESCRSRAALAYQSKHKCGIKGARNLLVTGW